MNNTEQLEIRNYGRGTVATVEQAAGSGKRGLWCLRAVYQGVPELPQPGGVRVWGGGSQYFMVRNRTHLEID